MLVKRHLTPIYNKQTKMMVNQGASLLSLRLNLCQKYFSPLFMRQLSSVTVQPLHSQATKFCQRLAIIDDHGHYIYQQLIDGSQLLSVALGSALKSPADKREHGIVNGPSIAFLCPNDVSYTLAQWATWKCGGIAVPLSKFHPLSELEYVVSDSKAEVVISSGPSDYHEKMSKIATKLTIPHYQLNTRELLESPPVTPTTDFDLQDKVLASQGAQIVYTSGTTGRPKGVLVTHGNLVSQIITLVKVWGWSKDDSILHVLPLHHVHGIVNALACPLWCGATCHMLPKFDPDKVWDLLLHHHSTNCPPVTVFTAVPTIYYNLIQHYEDAGYSQKEKEHIKRCLQMNIRLMMCGSAALPAPIMTKWHSITGHWLLERYGMTEIGMALANPLHGTRVPGAVGLPLESVSVQIVDSESGSVLAEGDANGTTMYSDAVSSGGDLHVKGPSVFLEYWNRPTTTAESFTDDGWFKTGDTAAFYDNTYHIMGRTSTDIIKSGGYKTSALDVERHLLAHPDIADVAILAVDDIKWGEIVAAVIVQKREVDVGELQQWSKLHIPSYSVPRLWKFVSELPRNAMGKVNKKLLAPMFYTSNEQDKQLLVNSYFQELMFPGN